VFRSHRDVYADRREPGVIHRRWLGEVETYTTAEARRLSHRLGAELRPGERLVLVFRV
jgi:hypothetical protein